MSTIRRAVQIQTSVRLTRMLPDEPAFKSL